MEKDLAIVTVIGKDQTGIVAHISTALYEEQVNIEDITQSIMSGFFVMGMLVDLKRSPKNIKELRARLHDVGERIGVSVHISNMRTSLTQCIACEDEIETLCGNKVFKNSVRGEPVEPPEN